MADTEITYCDDYEAITGKSIPTAVVETKVVTAPADTPVFNAVEAEVK